LDAEVTSHAHRGGQPPPVIPPGAQTLARGLDVLRAVADGATNLSSVLTATGLSRSTAHRLAQLLREYGYLHSADGTEYVLGPALIDLGFRAVAQNPVPRVARPLLQELADALLDTVHLAVEDSGQVLYLDKIDGQRGAEMRSRIGQRMPLTRTGVGMALLLDRPGDWAGLYEAETSTAAPARGTGEFVSRMCRYSESGVTLDLEDNEIGIRCVAAPVRDATRGIVAAISVSATTPYMPRARMRALGPVVLRNAQMISRQLGHAE
jgi:DNA-binding IclR family transcriptional regulator